MGGGGALLASNSQLLTSLAESPAPSVVAVAPLFGDERAAARAIEALRGARLELARVLATPAELPARVAALRRLASGPPPYGPARDELAWQLRRVGRAALGQRDALAARVAFAEATLLSPLDWRSRVELAWALRESRDSKGAEASLRSALELAPHAAPAHYELAGLLAGSGRHQEAIAHFRAAAEARPGWADPRNDLAWLLATDPEGSLAQRAEALSLAESAVALSGQRDPQILDTLAVAYAASGRPDAARDAAERAVAVARELRPDLVTRLEARSAAIARGEMPDARPESTP
jgi:tetratricopeptide (TPR) repeat protein